MEQKIVIDYMDTAKFVCPECKREKIKQLSQYPITRKKTKVRCTCRCGFSYIVVLTKKNESTQDVLLHGTFISREKVKCSGKMIIKKLNSKGLMLKTTMEQRLLPGIKVFLEFVLDDAKQSIVKKEVVVKALQGKYLSAEFTCHDHDDNLGPYLAFHQLNI